MDFRELERLLYLSIEDHSLDTNEKHQFRVLTENVSLEKIRFMRNKAFHLVREQLQHGADIGRLLKWLEQLLKALDANTSESRARVCFSPGEQCLVGIIDVLHGAKVSVDICVFTISDDRITTAIRNAHERGVAVRIISDNDKSNDRGSDIDLLQQAGLAVKLDRSPNHMHHKFAIVDDKTLLNGSFNWTRSASEYNEENIVIVDDPHQVAAFSERFEALWLAYD